MYTNLVKASIQSVEGAKEKNLAVSREWEILSQQSNKFCFQPALPTDFRAKTVTPTHPCVSSLWSALHILDLPASPLWS